MNDTNIMILLRTICKASGAKTLEEFSKAVDKFLLAYTA